MRSLQTARSAGRWAKPVPGLGPASPMLRRRGKRGPKAGPRKTGLKVLAAFHWWSRHLQGDHLLDACHLCPKGSFLPSNTRARRRCVRVGPSRNESGHSVIGGARVLQARGPGQWFQAKAR
jgi:hypothetical protein